jgi:LacI family transcriptional regulator, fructose operon transcriptional repressor
MTAKDQKKATIYDISVESGASASTVSAVLNGSWKKRRISEETANRIISLAKAGEGAQKFPLRLGRASRAGL